MTPTPTSPSARSRRSLVVSISLAVVVVAIGIASWRPLAAWFTGKPLGGGGAAVTAAAGALSLTARLDPDPPGTKDQALVIEVRDPEGKPVDDAHVEVAYDMPAMGAMAEMKGGAHVAREANGRYRATFDLPMGGTWTLRATVQAGAGSGSLAFTMTVGNKGLSSAASGEIDHYTCSMHPSVKQAGPGKCPLCSMDLAPVTKGQREQGVVTIDEARRQLIGVRTAAVTASPMRSVFRAVGRVAYDESRLADVSLKVRGWITKLSVSRTGERVARGQTLFTVFSPELYNAQQDFLLATRDAPALLDGGGGRAELLGRASRQRLRLLGLSDAEVDALAKRGAPTESIPIRSPASGFVVEKNVVEGASVEAGMRLYRIAELDRVWIEAEIYEADVASVRAGQSTVVTLDYMPGRTFDGKVAYVYPYVDDKTRTGRARVELANKDLELKPGMYARVELARDLGSRVQVPAAAVVYTGPRLLVFVDLGQGRFEPREVRVGVEAEGMYEVIGGLEAGDVVATSGVFLIAAEARISTAAKYWESTPEADAGGAATPPTPAPSAPMPMPMPMPRSRSSIGSPALAASAPPPARSFTCPMHPEVESATRGACPKCGMPLEPRKGRAP